MLVLLVLMLLLLLLLMDMRLRRCGTGLIATSHVVVVRVDAGRGAGGDRLLLPAIAIEVFKDGTRVKATVILILVPELQQIIENRKRMVKTVNCKSFWPQAEKEANNH